MSASQRLLLAVAGALVGALLQQTWQLLALLVVAVAALLCVAALRLASPGWLLRRVALLNVFVALVWLTLPWQVVYRRAELERGGCAGGAAYQFAQTSPGCSASPCWPV
ncbi:hypothetical protein UMZ34_05390 [Halopseudomonas pachastrellae]|nr:hypothetical protein UMZ34_05390 [Halopseudomonas pachastrellae]